MQEASENHVVVELTAVIWQEGDDFVSFCPEVGVSSCGSTLEEAKATAERHWNRPGVRAKWGRA